MPDASNLLMKYPPLRIVIFTKYQTEYSSQN